MRTKIRKIGTAVSIVLLLIGAWIASDLYYFRSISPKDISTVADFFQKFGEPRRARALERNGTMYVEFMGRGSRLAVFAMPSAPPVYIFDEKGRFVEWCADRGETRSGYTERWPLGVGKSLEISEVRKMFGL